MWNDLHLFKGNLLEESAGDAITQRIAASEDADGAMAVGQKFGDGVLDGATPAEGGGGEGGIILQYESEVPIAADDEARLGEKGAIDRSKGGAIADAENGEPRVHREMENEELRIENEK